MRNLRDIRDELVIQTSLLTKRFPNGTVGANDVDLHVRRGDVYGFLGPNGAGKTTTLRMLVGLTNPTSGTANIAGCPIGSPQSLLKVGCLIESPAFYPYLSGRDNLLVIADYARVARARVDDALELAELTSRAHDPFKNYSLGMKQRLGLAAATLKDPELLILDEPTNGLDPQGMADMRTLITQIAKGGRTVLVSSHLLGEVGQMCTRLGIIRRGRLVAEGTIDELVQAPGDLEITAHPLPQAAALLEQLLGEGIVTLADQMLHVQAPAERAAEINRALISAGIEVSRLTPREKSLEDVFLELTGGDTAL
ncbi:MAG: ATP-binding cassette domain-containing protein [Candidatus Dormibacteraceae bacterium]